MHDILSSMGYVVGAIVALTFAAAAGLLAQVQPSPQLRLWAIAFGARAVAVSARAASLLLLPLAVTPLWLALDATVGVGRLAFAVLEYAAARHVLRDARPFPRRSLAALAVAALGASLLRPAVAVLAGSLGSPVVLAAMAPRLLLEALLLGLAAAVLLRAPHPRGRRFLAIALAVNAALPAMLALDLLRFWLVGGRPPMFAAWPWLELVGYLLLGFAGMLRVVREVRKDAVRRLRATASATAALEASQARLVAAWAHTDDRVVLVDRERRIVAHNAAWEQVIRQFYAPPPGPLVGQPIGRFESLSSADARWDEWYAAALSGQALTVPLHIRPGHGAELLEARLSPIEENGVVTGALLTLRDVSERQRLGQALAQAQRMESIGRLAGGIAHDFNNLLTAIQGNVALARMSLPADAPVQEDLVEIEACSRRAGALTRQLLAFARRQPVEPRVLEPAAELRQLERMLCRLLGSDIEMRITAAPDTWTIRADASQLEQVIVNLAVNARDAMPDGGLLHIDVGNVHLDAAQAAGIPEASAGEWVRLSVRDVGPGIPPEVMERIFEPFFTTKGPGAGTGLGLAVCHGIVRQAGGFITVTSRPQMGTTFEVHLPREHAAADAPAAPAEPDPLPRGEGTLLLVEDEAPVRIFAARALRHLGYDVIEAADGVEALQALEQELHTPLLVVSDLVMPRMGGRQLLRRVREHWPALPVLLTSAYDGGTGDDEPSRLADGFLAKPYTVDALARRVHELAGPRRVA